MNEIYERWLKEATNFKHLKDWKTGMPRLILKAFQTKDKKSRGNVSRIITGPPGSGKSMYTYKIMAKTHYDFNGFTTKDDEEESYKYALDKIIYRPRELFNTVERTLKEDVQELYICGDDASIHMGRQLFDQDRQAYRRLQGTVPTLRENFACVFLTTVDVSLLAKPWREFIKHKVIIISSGSEHDYTCFAKHYEKWFFPDDVRFRIAVLFQDRFSRLVPEPFYSWYHDKKIKALREYNETVKNWRPVVKGDEPTEEDADT